MLLAVETFSELPQVRAMVKFFGPSGSRTDEDQDGILGQDELALSTVLPDAPVLGPTTPASVSEHQNRPQPADPSQATGSQLDRVGGP